MMSRHENDRQSEREIAKREREKAAFVSAVKAMENRNRMTAYVVLNPADPLHNGRVVISYPPNGHGEGRLHVVAWLPGETASDSQRHHKYVSGYGYDKATAAMGGAKFWNLKTGKLDTLADQGYDTRWQLEQA